MILPIAAALAGLAGLLGGSRLAVVDAAPQRVKVPKELLRFDDGDSVHIAWAKGVETVRILGIDTPEVQHLDHDIPYAQPFGEKAAGFLEGCLAVADRVELLRSGDKDPHGRTLGYLFLDGKNYSVLVIEARLAVENVTKFGDNGLPKQAARVVAAARKAGPVPFEMPYRYRRRMSELATWMKAHGRWPKTER